jgi:DNA-binding response OmpR family regulator
VRVLVVSQDIEVRRRAATALQARPDVEVIEAASGAEGHIRVAEDGLDVVVMDGDMRPEGGYSVIYEIRAAAQLREEEAPSFVVLMDREQDRWLAQWAGADAAFLKPANPFALAERVAELGGGAAGGEPRTGGRTAGKEMAMDEPPELEHEEAPPVPG